jgi:hypothetical protein
LGGGGGGERKLLSRMSKALIGSLELDGPAEKRVELHPRLEAFASQLLQEDTFLALKLARIVFQSHAELYPALEILKQIGADSQLALRTFKGRVREFNTDIECFYTESSRNFAFKVSLSLQGMRKGEWMLTDFRASSLALTSANSSLPFVHAVSASKWRVPQTRTKSLWSRRRRKKPKAR